MDQWQVTGKSLCSLEENGTSIGKAGRQEVGRVSNVYHILSPWKPSALLCVSLRGVSFLGTKKV